MSAVTNTMSSGIRMFFIQKLCCCSVGKTNSMPAFSFKAVRFMRPVSSSAGVFATSACTVVFPIVTTYLVGAFNELLSTLLFEAARPDAAVDIELVLFDVLVCVVTHPGSALAATIAHTSTTNKDVFVRIKVTSF